MVSSFFKRVIDAGSHAVGPSRDAITPEARMHALRAASLPAAGVQTAAARLNDERSPAQAERRPGSELTVAEVTDLIAKKMTIVTADEDHPLYLEPSERASIIVYEDMTMIVATAHRNSMLIADVKNRARSCGTPIQIMRTTDFETLKKLQNLASDADPTSSIDFTRNQQRLYELIESAAKRRASDIHLKIDQEAAHLYLTIKGDFIYLNDMQREEADSLMIAAFNACKTGDKQYNPLKFRATRLDNSPDFVLPRGVQSLRLQFSPLDNAGRELVARLLYMSGDDDLKDVDSLGYEPPQIDALHIMRRQAYGIILISGPTGSGKSTTLKTALERTWLERKGRAKLVSIEDPPEFAIRGCSQLPIESGANLEEKAEAFTRAMSATLRMAPHIIMVGEIREAIAAKLTFDAAKTGHLVWTSVHANTALDTINRLADMHVRRVDLEDPKLMRGLIAQRLVKIVCPHCSLPFRDAVSRNVVDLHGGADRRAEDPGVDPWLIDFYKGLGPALTGNIRLARNNGCEHCRDSEGKSTGHIGRRVIAETVVPTDSLLKAAVSGHVADARAEWLATPGAFTMLEHGLFRVLSGEVDPRDLTYAGDVTRDIDVARIGALIELLAQDRGGRR